jgi:transglutaminase/protease-like cytokinesis protein 3
MKVFLSAILALVSLFCFAQEKSIVHVVNNTKCETTERLTLQTLSQKLTTPYILEADKVRSIFRWITDNIAYNVKPYYTNMQTSYREDAQDDTGSLRSLSERVAEGVLQKKVAFCDGYARLFKTLCDYAGIKSEVITGYARTNISKVDNKFRSNHRWNAVLIDNKWHLLDATWASGYVTYASHFIPYYNDYYYLTPPADFIRDHYPEDLNWSLLASPPTLKEFNHTPFKNQAFSKNKIIAYKPAKGLIEASVGDTVKFELETDAVQKKLWVSDTAYIDTAATPIITVLDSAKSFCTIAGNKITYAYIVTSPSVEWLNVIFNDDAILRYKINIKKNYTAAN